MDRSEYILASECENLFENMDNFEKNLPELGGASTIDKQENYLQSYETSSEIEEAVKSIANDDEAKYLVLFHYFLSVKLKVFG